MSNNIEAIREDYRIGDSIRIACSLGLKEGYILDISEKRIKLQPYDRGKKPISISEDSIMDFEEGTPMSTDPANSAERNEFSIVGQTNQTPKTIKQTEQDDKQDFSVIKFQSNKTKLSSGGKIDTKSAATSVPTLSKSIEKNDAGEQKNILTNIDIRPVSALGKIEIIDEGGISGIIFCEATGKSYKFYEQEVIDKNIIKNRVIGSLVVFSVIKLGKELYAESIHCPNTISNYLLKAEKILKTDTLESRQTAYNIAIQILRQYPECAEAQALRDKLPTYLTVPVDTDEEAIVRENNKKNTKNMGTSVSPNKDDSSEGATKITQDQTDLLKKFQDEANSKEAIAELKKMMNSSAIKYQAFNLIIGKYVRLYIDEYKDENNRETYRAELLRFIDQYINEFQETKELLKTVLLPRYQSIQADERIIDVIGKLEKLPTDSTDMSSILTVKAQSLYNLGKEQEAIETITQAIDMNPKNDIARNKLREYNFVFVDAGDTDKQIEAPGLTLFLQHAVNNYKDYRGISEHDIPKRNFTKKGIEAIKNRVKYLKKQKNVEPKELAELSLSWTKVLAQIQPTNYEGMYARLRDFCNYKAYEEVLQLPHKPDVIRFFLEEFLTLVSSTNQQAGNVIILKYLSTYLDDSNSLQRAFNKNISKKDAPEEIIDLLKKLSSFDEFDLLWSGLMTIGQKNGAIADIISFYAFSCNIFRDKAIGYMQKTGVTISIGATEEQFRRAWNEASLRHSRRNQDTTNRLIDLTKATNIRDFEEMAQAELISCLSSNNWINSLDKERLEKIQENTLPLIKNYIEDNKFQNKERYYTELIRDIERAEEGILRHPSTFAYNGIHQVINHIKKLAEESFERIIKLSEPEPKIGLLNSEVIADNEGKARLQFNVWTQSGASPISQIELVVEDYGGVKPIGDSPVPYSKSLNGGSRATFTQLVKISQKVIDTGATGIRVMCKYRKRDNQIISKEEELPLRLKNEDSFTKIENPYIIGQPLSFGIQGKADVFYGRNELISKIEDKLKGASPYHCILYGQKRSGKTSIINKIKYDLGGENGPFLCVEFSVTALPEPSLRAMLYQILYSVGEELEELTDKGMEAVPDYIAPSGGEFCQMAIDCGNEINAFKKEFRKLKNKFSSTKGWENKRVLLLIDEFTTIYNLTTQRKLDQSFMQQWKAVIQDQQFTISEVLIGQAITPKFQSEPYARNAFQVFENWEVTYLEPKYAKELIIKPTIDDQGSSRYVEAAYKRIIELTAGSPYYMQYMCSLIVDYINENKLLKVTEPDVNSVADKMITTMKKDNFDNLYDDGSGHLDRDSCVMPKEEVEAKARKERNIRQILIAIAVGSDENGYCNRSDIDKKIRDADAEEINKILKDLSDIKVIEIDRNDYRIIVKLFEKWIIRNQTTFSLD